MKNHEKLRAKIKEHYKTYAQFAYDLGITLSALQGKLMNRNRWREDEVVGGCKLLGIPVENAGEYFDLSWGYTTKAFYWEKETELTDLIHERYGNIKDFARELGICWATLEHRLTGRRPWKKEEVEMVCELLQIEPDNVNRYIPKEQIYSDIWTERIHTYYEYQRDFLKDLGLDGAGFFRKVRHGQKWPLAKKSRAIQLLHITDDEIPLFFPLGDRYYQTILHERIHTYYDSIKAFGDAIGITTRYIYDKTCQFRPWTEDEMIKICELLHIDGKERKKYFIAKPDGYRRGTTIWYSK